jgi:hypothetical protein
MALRELGNPDDAAERRGRLLRLAEGRMLDAASAALRQFLRRVLEHTGPESLTAAVADDFPRSLRLFTIGEASGWWAAAVDDHVRSQVAAVWRAGYFDTRDGDLLASSGQQLGEYLANVTDRLSRTATPTIPEQAFDLARSALADEVARGSDVRTMSRRLAQEFSWDADATLDRQRLAAVDGRIDSILDAIGPPGDPRREAMRLADPEIARLQAERAEYVTRIDRVESTWQTRAERISRTETTGAYNAGALDAGFVEGQRVKVWMTTGDDRTRAEHLAASGQCVPLEDTFTVGGEALEMPGDPSGSAGMTINCRCTIVFADSCDEASDRFRRSREVVNAERRERGLEVDEGVDRPASPRVVGVDADN